jgi:hypothetical protein
MNEIQLYTIKTTLNREFLINQESIDRLLFQIEGLKNLKFDFSNKAGIKEAKMLKTNANKFIKKFKDFCDPLEEEGKKIASTRSRVKLALEKTVVEILRFCRNY